jgi:hypothetical protein
VRIEPIGDYLRPPAQSINEIQEIMVVAKTMDLEPHGREPVFDAPAILAERINFDRAVGVQHTEQVLHGIGHGSPPLRAIEAALIRRAEDLPSNGAAQARCSADSI